MHTEIRDQSCQSNDSAGADAVIIDDIVASVRSLLALELDGPGLSTSQFFQGPGFRLKPDLAYRLGALRMAVNSVKLAGTYRIVITIQITDKSS